MEAACHSRRISSVAAPKINTKKNNSFDNWSQMAISTLLEGSHRASSIHAPSERQLKCHSIRMTLVAAKPVQRYA